MDCHMFGKLAVCDVISGLQDGCSVTRTLVSWLQMSCLGFILVNCSLHSSHVQLNMVHGPMGK